MAEQNFFKRFENKEDEDIEQAQEVKEDIVNKEGEEDCEEQKIDYKHPYKHVIAQLEILKEELNKIWF